jgi:response regulator NasT
VIHANLLIADDEPLVRLDLRDLLTRNGHTVVGEASSGEEALALARSLRPDAVILDVVLPHHLSGLDVARALGGGRIAPVVVVTGHANPEVVEKANEAASSGFCASRSDPKIAPGHRDRDRAISRAGGPRK